MLGSSIKLSFLSRRTSKVQLREILSRQNRAKTAVLTHADHIQHVIACDQPIGMKQKRALGLSLSPAHEVFTRTQFVCLTSLDIILLYSY